MQELVEAVVAVPAAQASKYREHYGKRVIVVPDRHDGQIARKRNWILNEFVEDDDVIMIDDDVSGIWKFESPNGTTERVGEYRHKLNGEAVRQLALESFEIARGFHTVLWGMNQHHAFWTYRASPITLTNVILGPFMGIVKGCKLRFDERMGAKEDYDFSLQVLRRFRCIVRWQKYHYMADHGNNAGGITVQRSFEKEKAWAQAIMRKWGSSVISYDLRKKSILNGRVNCPIEGV